VQPSSSLGGLEELDDLVEAYEATWAKGEQPDLGDFLPAPAHPLYERALTELIRVDLEYHWNRGQARRLDHYLQRFPDLADQPTALRDIALEEQRLRDQAGSSPTICPFTCDRPGDSPSTLPVLPGYEVIEEIGRGGMGVVYKARQIALARVVALKRIEGEGSLWPGLLQRFQQEAHAIAHLNHPNIIQIYEVGEQDRQPFFSMEYVEGGTLADRVAGQPQPARQAARVIQVLAEAMAFAHSRGIVHRDLKPSNVLLIDAAPPLDRCTLKIGDFGLATRIQQEEEQTSGGVVLGTPSYMPPEQALGESWRVGPTADVYALGAMLYELLVGEPPFLGNAWGEVFGKLLDTSPVPPRRRNPAIPRDLEAICLKCLEKDPWQRYHSAGTLAEDLGRFLQGEPVDARATPPWERGAKWLRRHPTFAVMACTLFLAVLSLLAGGAYHVVEITRANASLEQQRLQIEHANKDLKQANEKLVKANKSERAQRLLADQRLRESIDIISDYCLQLGNNRTMTRQDKREALERALSGLNTLIQAANKEQVREWLARAHALLAQMEHEVGSPSRARACYEQAGTLYAALVKEEPDNAVHRQALADCQYNLGLLALAERKIDTAQKHFQDCLALRQDLADTQKNNPEVQNDLAEIYQSLGELYRVTGQARRAEAMYHLALQLNERLTEAHPDDLILWNGLAMTCNNLGMLAMDTGNSEQAQQYFTRARDFWVKLGSDHPDYRKRLATVHDNLGLLLASQGQAGQALKEHQTALAIRTALITDFSEYAEYKADWARSQNLLGNLQIARNDYPAAEKAYRAAQVMYQELRRQEPDNPGYRSAVASSTNNLALLYREMQQLDRAEQTAREALALQKDLIKAHPHIPRYRHELASGYMNLGFILQTRGQYKEASNAYHQALAIQEPLVKDAPEWPEFQLGLARTYINLGNLQREQRQSQQALSWYDRGIQNLDDVNVAAVGEANVVVLLQNALAGRARAFTEQNEHMKALADWKRLLTLKPRPTGQVLLAQANTLARLGDHQQAVAVVNRASQEVPEKTTFLEVATVYAQACAAAGKDVSLPRAERQQLQNQYAITAVGVLSRALTGPESGSASILEILQTRKDFDPLRSHPRFQELLQRLEEDLRRRSR
jgi:serine/threonine protein kinase